MIFLKHKKLLMIIFLAMVNACIDLTTIRPITARDFYEKGLDFLDKKKFGEAKEFFNKCQLVGDPVNDEYYISMCSFEVAFTYSEEGNQEQALKQLEILLSQVVTSKEPRILAENLRVKILADKAYQNTTF